MSFTPIVNQSFRYASGCQMLWIGNRSIAVMPGKMRNSTDINDIVVNDILVLNGNGLGLNGIDVGTIAASTRYYVYLIFDPSFSQPTGVTFSLSPFFPALPFNYGLYRYIGFLITDSSANFQLFYQNGNSNLRQYQWDSGIPVLNLGSEVTFTEVPLSAALPAQRITTMYAKYSYTTTVDGRSFSARSFGSSALRQDCPINLTAANAGDQDLKIAQIMIGLDNGEPAIEYLVNTSDTLSIKVSGFDDFI